MIRLIYLIINIIAKLHSKFLSLNDAYGLALSDKQLHFLIIGLFGFGMLVVLQPIIRWLCEHDGSLLITFAYVFSAILVITFAIEIGQGFSGTGDMDFKDILSGIFGFFVFFAIYLLGYLIWQNLFRKKGDKNEHTGEQ